MAFQNFYSSKISTDIGAGDNTITVDSAPTATSGRMVLESRNPTQREIIKYTGVAGDTLTGVTRGEGGTSAKNHTKGALIQQNATAEDLQDLYDAFGSFAATNNDWRTLVDPVGSVAYNGNRSYNMVFNGVDLTSILSPGMRLRTQRTVAAPTQCTSLNGSNQYYSKSSPVGMTFTDDFVVSAWIKLSSYQDSTIVSRYSGASGWALQVISTGQVQLSGYNGSASNNSQVRSYQSLPLNKWVHVTAQLDMSAFTATTTTSYVMIDGVNVPCLVARAGTNPTALVQAGNLEVGSASAGTFFPGKIAQAAVFNAKVTQATMRGYISQGLAGTETSLISAYSFNNSVTDLNTSNANNLTASGSAVATNADSPFGGQASGSISSTLDYGIIQSATFGGGNTTLIIEATDVNTIPTIGGVAAVSYSTQATPYGMPERKGGGYWAGVYSFSGGTGTRSISGIGFTPKMIRVNLQVTSTTKQFVSSGYCWYNGSSYIQGASASTTLRTNGSYTIASTTDAFRVIDWDSSEFFTARVTGFSSGTITVNVTQTNGTHVFSIEAFA